MRQVPLWAGAAGGLLVAAATALPMASALDRLEDARAARAEARTLLTAPPPPPVIAPAAMLVAADAGTAARRLATRWRQEAVRGGLLVETIAPAAAPAAGLAAIQLRVSGPERAVLAFVDSVERGTPLQRFDRWSLTADGASVRLDASLVAPWRG